MRLVFDVLKEFQSWIKTKTNYQKYDIYVTKDNEVVFVPIKSTRPNLYGYMKLTKLEDIDTLEKDLNLAGYNVFKVKAIEWADDRGIGLKL